MPRVHVCAVHELPAGRIASVCAVGRRFAVYNVDGCYFATDDECTHGKSSLSEEGRLDGDEVVCGWHGGRFHFSTGKATRFPATVDLRTYMIRQDGDALYLELEDGP